MILIYESVTVKGTIMCLPLESFSIVCDFWEILEIAREISLVR